MSLRWWGLTHFVKCSDHLFHLYLKFIQQLEKGPCCTAVSHIQWMWEPMSRLQMSPHCHLTVHDWNLFPVSGAENCHRFLPFIMYCLNWKHFPDWIDLLENSTFILKMQDCCNILFKRLFSYKTWRKGKELELSLSLHIMHCCQKIQNKENWLQRQPKCYWE